MPKPEDPVVLPTDEETAKLIKNRREMQLRQLSWDKDGWDDLEIMLIQSKHKDYKFEPNNKTKDTDGDGKLDVNETWTYRATEVAQAGQQDFSQIDPGMVEGLGPHVLHEVAHHQEPG